MAKEIFSTIPEAYDTLNRLVSLRRDVAWRRFAVMKICPFQTNRFLDVGIGTADLAIEAALRNPRLHVVGLDFTEEMITLARKKVEKKRLEKRIDLLKGNALALPFSSDSFDAAAVAFTIRNVPDKLGVLREMFRVVIPAGQVLILEMSFPRTPFLGRLYHIYLSKIVPLAARALSPNPEAYLYLADSIVNFPSPEEFKQRMEHAGLLHVEIYALTGGIAHLFVGHKPIR